MSRIGATGPGPAWLFMSPSRLTPLSNLGPNTDPRRFKLPLVGVSRHSLSVFKSRIARMSSALANAKVRLELRTLCSSMIKRAIERAARLSDLRHSFVTMSSRHARVTQTGRNCSYYVQFDQLDRDLAFAAFQNGAGGHMAGRTSKWR
jgi:hypothetical protein